MEKRAGATVLLRHSADKPVELDENDHPELVLGVSAMKNGVFRVQMREATSEEISAVSSGKSLNIAAEPELKKRYIVKDVLIDESTQDMTISESQDGKSVKFVHGA